MKNPFLKSRKPGNAYVTVVDPRSGWKYEVLKLYKSVEASKKDRFARALCFVRGSEAEYGDTYLADIPGVYPALEQAEAAMKQQVADLEAGKEITIMPGMTMEKVGLKKGGS